MRISPILTGFMLSFCLLQPQASQAESLTLPEFLKASLKQSPEIQAQSQTALSADLLIKASDPTWLTTLTLMPRFNISERDVDIPGQFLEDRAEYWSLGVGARQNLIGGLQWDVSYDRTLGTPSSKLSIPSDESWTGRLAIPLWRNLLGREWRLQIQESRAEAERQHHLLTAEQFRICMENTGLYAQAYLQQERHELYRAQNELAQKALKLVESLGRQGLVRQIDLLSARDDLLRFELELRKIQLESDDSFRQLRARLENGEATRPLELASPESDFSSEVAFENNLFLAHPQLKASQKAVESLLARARKAREESRSRWDLFGEYRENRGRYLGSDDNYRSYVFGFNIEWPLINHVNEARHEATQAQAQAAVFQSEELSRNLQLEVAAAIEQREFLLSSLKIIESRQELLARRTREAYQLMRQGNLTFKNYLDYRDMELRNEVERLMTYESLWRLSSLLFLLSDQGFPLCPFGGSM